MPKEFYVLRAGRVVYTPGHYDLEGAEATAQCELDVHPKAVLRIVKIVETLVRAPEKADD